MNAERRHIFWSTSLRVRETLSGSSVSFPQTLRLIGVNRHTLMLFLRNEGKLQRILFLKLSEDFFLLVWAAGSETCKTNQNNPRSEPWHLAAFVTTSISCAALICRGQEWKFKTRTWLLLFFLQE